MRLLVTGRDGQLARSLGERGCSLENLEITFVGRPEIDFASPGGISAAIEAAQPDVVINAAAYTDVDRAEEEAERALRINADAAGEVAEAAAKVGAPIVQMSTDYVFDGASHRPYSENDATHPLNVYGASKLTGEERVRAANPRHLILRTSWVVSPFGRNFVKTMVTAAQSRDHLTVVDDQRGRPTSALDLADAILAIAATWGRGDHCGLGTTYHVAGTGDTSWFGLASEVMDECRRRGAPAAEVSPIPSSDWPTRAARPRYSVLDCTRFEQEFGISLPPWQESVRAIVGRLLAG